MQPEEKKDMLLKRIVLIKLPGRSGKAGLISIPLNAPTPRFLPQLVGREQGKREIRPRLLVRLKLPGSSPACDWKESPCPEASADQVKDSLRA